MIKDAVVDAAHELVTDVKKVLNINSKIFKTGINAGIGAAAVVALGLGLPAAIGCAFAAVAVGAVLGVGKKAVVTFANGGTYDDFLCGLEDDIYSGAEFMSMMFMMTATTAESVCSAMDKGLEEYLGAQQKYNEAKWKYSGNEHFTENEIYISPETYEEILKNSYHNIDKDKVMLGKYDGGGPTSYITRAGDDYAYFDMGTKWNDIKFNYGLTEDDMFRLFNQSFLDDGINSGKTFYFSHDPFEAGGALEKEFQYLLKHNYIYDKITMTMSRA